MEVSNLECFIALLIYFKHFQTHFLIAKLSLNILFVLLIIATTGQYYGSDVEILLPTDLPKCVYESFIQFFVHYTLHICVWFCRLSFSVYHKVFLWVVISALCDLAIRCIIFCYLFYSLALIGEKTENCHILICASSQWAHNSIIC